MAMSPIVVALFFFFTVAFSGAESKLIKGSVNCLDCTHDSDLSGIQVLVKCYKVKKLAMAYTEEDGTFKTELPSDNKPNDTPLNLKCMAKIMGGPNQLYTLTKNSVTEIAKANGQFMTIANPLSFFKSCPLKAICGAKDEGFGSSKTVDLPLPREWGLAPTSYYIPFFPIIGIP